MLNPDQLNKLKKSLIKHEKYANFPYVDTVGKITIGIGYNLTDRGITDKWIQSQFIDDIYFFLNKLADLPFFFALNFDRQIILIDMAFMGWQKFLTFKKMLQALEDKDYDKAANEMLDSKWAQQVGDRAKDLAEGMRSGVYDV